MPDVPLVTLVYVSSAVVPFTDDELAELLNRSRVKNAAIGVTGLLLYEGGNIIQVLEGPEDAVEPLFTRIQSDARHRGVCVLLRAPIERRRFPDWAMGLRRAIPVPAEDAPSISRYLQDRLEEAPTPGDRVETLLQVFRHVVQVR